MQINVLTYLPKCFQDRLNLKHPDWVTEEIYPQGKHQVQAMFFKLQTYNRIMKRLKMGAYFGFKVIISFRVDYPIAIKCIVILRVCRTPTHKYR